MPTENGHRSVATGDTGLRAGAGCRRAVELALPIGSQLVDMGDACASRSITYVWSSQTKDREAQETGSGAMGSSYSPST